MIESLSFWVFSFNFKNPQNLSLNRNLSPNGLGHFLTLGVNYLLCVFGVGFQLYDQLKESPHDGMRVLGSSAILTASQTTRLGRNSTWHETNTCLRDPIMVRSTSSEFIKTLLSIFFSYSSILSFIPLFLSSLCDLIISPVPTCLSAQLWDISEVLFYFHLLSLLFHDQSPLIPISNTKQAELRNRARIVV